MTAFPVMPNAGENGRVVTLTWNGVKLLAALQRDRTSVATKLEPTFGYE